VTVTEISDHKIDKRIVVKIEKINSNGIGREKYKTTYFPNPDEKQLLKRELEVLNWVLEGLIVRL
jgi:hypothetical protein